MTAIERCGWTARRLAAWLLAVAALSAAAQAPLPAGVRGPDGLPSARPGAMATRSVALYLERERGLAAALARRDRAAVRGQLADDFVARSAASQDVDSADPWLRRETAPGLAAGQVRELSVLEVDDLAVVSFLLDRAAPGKSGAGVEFVVDVWRQSSQRLLSRSVSQAAKAPPRPPRPSGRE